MDLYRKVTTDLPGGQAIRRQFNAVCNGFRVIFGDVLFFTATPDRRHSKLVWRLMRCRKNDVALLHDDAAKAWRKKFAGPDVPKLYANDDEEFDEDVSFDLDVSLFNNIPAVQEAIAMSARDPLSTVLHYDVYVRVILAYLAGLRMCLHCPRCSKEKRI